MAALLATSMSVSGGVMHIVMHAFGKITLFFCAGAILVGAHKDSVRQMDGLGRRMPLTMAAFSGGSLDTGTWFWIAVLMISTLLNIAYLLPIPLRAFFKPEPEVAAGEHDHDHGDAPAACRYAIGLTAAVTMLLFFYPDPLTDLVSMIAWR